MFTGSEIQYEPVTGEGVMLLHKDGSSLRLNVISGQIAMQVGSQPTFEAPLPKMSILKEHKEQILARLEERKEAILKKRKSRAETYLRAPFTVDSVPQTPMSEINVDHLLEQLEERHNPRDGRDSPKRFTISPEVKQDIKNTLAVGDNGKIYFKKKKKSRMLRSTGRVSLHDQAMITAVEEQTVEEEESSEDEAARTRMRASTQMKHGTAKLLETVDDSRVKSTLRPAKASPPVATRPDSGESEELIETREGEGALLNYREFYKQGARIIEKHKLQGRDIDNPLLSYLNKVTLQQKAPKGFGLVHRKTKNEINLQSFYLRESYVDAFSDGLQLSKNLVKLNLSRNQLTTKRLIKILLKLPKTLRDLNLANNPQIGPEALKVLSDEIIDSTSYKLEVLSLEGCHLNDIAIKPLAQALVNNSSLRLLDISRNRLREAGANDLAQMLAINNTLSVLFLHWNRLQPKGGMALARALVKNNTLQVLDASYCSMGGLREDIKKIIEAEVKVQVAAINKIKLSKNGMDPEKMEKDLKAYFLQVEEDKAKMPSQSPRQALPVNPASAEAWKECFQQNQTLLHLDFSNNDFAAPEVEVMGKYDSI